MIQRVLPAFRRKAKSQIKRRSRAAETRIVRVGHRHLVFRDLYVNLLSMPWALLLLLIAVFYLALNFTFAGLYYAHIDGIDQAHSFADVFFFSVQTMATIGYGHMAPVSLAANVLTTVEALLGFMYFAFVTGLMFAKFSRPTAQVLFSKIAVISNFEGKPHLKIRLANKRSNSIVDATARVFLLRYGVTKEGSAMRRFVDLPIIRDHMPILRLTWTILHPIDKESPFFGLTQKDMEESDDELFVTISGLDETLSQTVHARTSYLPDEIIRDAFFEDVLKRSDRTVEVNYKMFDSVRFGSPGSEGGEVRKF